MIFFEISSKDRENCIEGPTELLSLDRKALDESNVLSSSSKSFQERKEEEDIFKELKRLDC
jgi:hypothetical protein